MHIERFAVTFALWLVPFSALAAAERPSFDLTLESWVGPARFGAQSFKSGSGCGGNLCTQEMLNGTLATGGVSLVARSGRYAFGILFDGSGKFDTVDTTDAHLGALGGVAHDPVRWLRLEALGEIGAHEVIDIGLAGIAASGDTHVWLPYAGIRPGITLRLGVVGPLRFVTGFWAFARFDLAHRDAVVSFYQRSLPDGSAQYHVGGWNLGFAYRLGFEL